MIRDGIWRDLNLTDAEYIQIKERLGREPNFLELSLFSAMWSEHCGYKNTRPLFSNFPTTGERVLQGPGENAGIVDIGDGLAVTMKVESHNHPSALAPFEGAATGAGGIIRDILAVGAEPVALLNSLHFGPLEKSARNKFLLKEVVHGIGEYGNCVGIPTIGGEVKFADCYGGNPLVNAMCVGLLKVNDIKKAIASGPGNALMIVGNWTGRDGVGGASFASKELHEESDDERSAVQVGDPFMEKLLIEACLEVFKEDYVLGVQDLGAAGLISSTSETADKGNSGVEIDISLVPQREKGMEPWEVMLSESQERMLLIVEAGREQEVNKIFHKWDLHAVVIGRVTEGDMLTVKNGSEVVGEVPVKLLADAPTYRRTGTIPGYMADKHAFDTASLPEPEDYQKAFMAMVGAANLSSREWVYEHYDQQVLTNTVVRPGQNAGVFRIKGTQKAVAVTMDSNGRYGYLNPYRGAQLVVAESARNLVAQGALPIAVTDGLNFGNPEKLDVYFQLEESIKGISDACRALNTPVISGNASLYNETPDGAIYPTPIIGMVGLIENVDNLVTSGWKEEGDTILVVGTDKGEVGASEYLRNLHNEVSGDVPDIDLALAKKTNDFILDCIQQSLIRSAQDIGDGGLAQALAECTITGRKGAMIHLEPDKRLDFQLFSETPGRFLISVAAANLDAITTKAKNAGIAVTSIGRVAGNSLNIRVGETQKISADIQDLDAVYHQYIEKHMEV
jgi:phosphoribosylformylglycinamidine synthase II